MKRSATAIFALCLSGMILLSEQTGFACVRTYPTFRIRGDFSVSVRGRDGQPVEGVTVRIVFAIPTLDLAAEQVTDKQGRAFFRALMMSDYWISAERAGVSSTTGKLWPVMDDSGGTEITLTWPQASVTKVQQVSGYLVVGRERAVLAGADAWLTDTVTGKELGRLKTDENGKFSFNKTDPGLYVLHIDEPLKCSRPMCKFQGNILVEVDPAAHDAELPRYGLQMSDCGLSAIKDDGSWVMFE